MDHPSISAIYCDDIRNELGGKLSFIGVYSAEMQLPTFPVTLPKFCVFVSIKLAIDQYPKEYVRVRLFDGENVIASLDIDQQNLEKSKPSVLGSDQSVNQGSTPDEQSIILSVGFTLAPLLLQSPTSLKVRATIDDEEFKGNSLKIRLANEQEQHLFGASPANP